MSTDTYLNIANNPVGKAVAKRVGLPTPPRLRRYEPGQGLLDGPALVGAAAGGRMDETVKAVLADTHVSVETEHAEDSDDRYAAIIFDATGISDPAELRELYDFFHPVARSLRTCGRMVVIGTTPDLVKNPAVATAQQAIEGFTRSLAKEIGSGSTCQLIYVDKGAESAAESTLRFVLSARSAYVSGQVITVAKPEPKDPPETTDWTRPLDGKVALVTGASRGIGESIAETLARDGAHVIVLDVPAQGGALSEVANRLDGESLQLDVTADDAPTKLAEYLTDRHGGVDILIHNAGITRDKTLARMSDDQWDSVLGVNLTSQQRINDALFEGDVINAGGRIVCVSSMGGIAGNRGQTNYGASKAGIIGMVRAFAPVAKGTPATINAVAPGFIATDMTQKMPLVVKEAGRRMNSMNQAGTPKDVAETIAWMAQPGSGGVNGQVVRVCGQSLIGA